VTNIISQLERRILNDLIEKKYNNLEEEEHNKCRARGFYTDKIFCLKQVIVKKITRNQEIYIAFIYLQKIYDTVSLVKL
jgi:hypothetical protein